MVFPDSPISPINQTSRLKCLNLITPFQSVKSHTLYCCLTFLNHKHSYCFPKFALLVSKTNTFKSLLKIVNASTYSHISYFSKTNIKAHASNCIPFAPCRCLTTYLHCYSTFPKLLSNHIHSKYS